MNNDWLFAGGLSVLIRSMYHRGAVKQWALSSIDLHHQQQLWRTDTVGHIGDGEGVQSHLATYYTEPEGE